jgi:cellulose synthase/poly-beta-1,6-N-acetylglucosamine synthase-like glycosyltransferase
MSVNQLVLLCAEVVLLIGASGLFILSFVLLVECVAAILPLSSKTSSTNRQNTKIAVIIPAHNEELVINQTITKLKYALQPQDRVVVIADNCIDTTAELARIAGATVIERHDLQQRGKGYALDCGLEFLSSNPPEVVVFIDADCQVDKNAIALISQQAITLNRPVQATYLMAKPNQPSPKDSISAFAFKVKNLVRSRGMEQLGISCLLAGTGMAFPWSVIRSVNVANSDIVEDMKLGFDLNIAGYPSSFCPDARVIGNLPTSTVAAKSQRTRWEHGHLQTILKYVPQLVSAALRQKRFDLLMSAIDLCIPPLSLFTVIWFGVTFVSLLFALVTTQWIANTIAVSAGVMLLTAILISWAKFARSDLPLRELFAIPFYIIWKMPLYLKFLIQPQKVWIRTERE